LVAGSVAAATAHLVSSSAMVFTVMEHLVSASGTVAGSYKIGGTAFASASTVGSFGVV
jgi:hypothetical protein